LDTTLLLHEPHELRESLQSLVEEEEHEQEQKQMQMVESQEDVLLLLEERVCELRVNLHQTRNHFLNECEEVLEVA
jgi:hypothetical protein